MARGDFTLFEEFAENIGEHDLSADTLKLGIVDNTLAPTAATATPTWGDFSANEVATTGGYTADGETLTYAGVTRWEEADGVATLDADNISLSQDASGFTDAYYAILYNSTHASDLAIGFIDLGGPVSEQAGPVAINWNASGVLTVTVDNS